MVDMGVYKLASRLAEELAAQLDDTRAGPTCFVVVHPGANVPAYGCECDGGGEGQAWVRVVSMTPTVTYPNHLLVAQRRSEPIVYALVLEMGVFRCYPSTEHNEMPPIAYLDSAARDALDDAAAMMRAGRCAFTNDEQPISGIWEPRGNQGGIHGGVMTVTVLADVDCACDVTPRQLDETIAPLAGDPRFG